MRFQNNADKRIELLYRQQSKMTRGIAMKEKQNVAANLGGLLHIVKLGRIRAFSVVTLVLEQWG